MSCMKDDLFLIDTNIFVYAFDSSEKIKQKIAFKLIDKCFRGERVYALSSQNLAEFFNIVTKKIQNPISLQDAKNIMTKIIEFKGFIKLNYNQNTVINTIKLLEKDGLKFWDSLLIATMLENNIFNIYTENEKDFSKIKAINVINPFK